MMKKWEWHEALKDRVMKIDFTKTNGENRIMVCTLNETILPTSNLSEIPKRAKDTNPEVVAVWDVEAEGWRSFRIDSVNGWETISTNDLIASSVLSVRKSS